MKPQQLREELQEGDTADVRRRRGIVAVSLIGMASMAAVTLYQMGLIRHLPDPPLPRFDSDRVNASDTAYQYGVPDGTLTLVGHTTNAGIAAFGGVRRTDERPGCRWPPRPRRAWKPSLPRNIFSIKCRLSRRSGVDTASSMR
jgi:hypothetical protein